METVRMVLTQTPWWVWVLFLFLVSRGMKALRGGPRPLRKLVVIPLVFSIWGLVELFSRHAYTLPSLLMWGGTLAVGMAAGWALVSRQTITVDRQAGTLVLPGDPSTLILVLALFLGHYILGFLLAMDPQVGQHAPYALVAAALSGGASGIFVGKFAFYLRRYQAAS